MESVVAIGHPGEPGSSCGQGIGMSWLEMAAPAADFRRERIGDLPQIVTGMGS
jgi:hypothetical protein